MRQVLVCAVAPALALVQGACKHRLFTYSVDVKLSSAYTIDQAGTFNQQSTITSADVAKAFKLPSGARVKKLDIESLWIEAAFSDLNQATLMNVTGTQQGPGDAAPVTLFADYPIPITGGKAGQFALNELIEAGIGRLKTNLQDIAKDLGANRFNQITLRLTGRSTPAATRMVLGLTFEIKANVTYENCELIPWSDVGEECPGTGNPMTP